MDQLKLFGIEFNLIKLSIVTAIVSTAVFYLGLDLAYLFDWDEVNFAEASREMLVSKDYLKVKINYELFWEKPPLFFWLQILSYKCFGVNEMAARLPNVLFGTITLLFILYIGQSIKNLKFAFFWTLCLGGSLLPHFYYKTGLIDPVLNTFIFISITFLYKYYQRYEGQNKKHFHILLSGFFAGLATLTKGPIAILIIVPCWIAFSFIYKKIFKIDFIAVIIFILIYILSAGSWFLYDLALHGPQFFFDFLEYQIRLFETKDAGHGGPFYYHFIVLFLGTFPSSIFIYKSIRPQANDCAEIKMFKTWMSILLIWVLIIFSIVQTKIVHYSSLAYLPISFLSAYVLDHLDIKSMHFTKILRYIYIGLCSIFIFTLMGLTIVGNNLDRIMPYIKEEIQLKLSGQNIDWPLYELIIPSIFMMVCIFVYRHFKRGQVRSATYILFGSSFVLITLVYTLSFHKIIQYSQGGLVTISKSLVNKDAYVSTFGFKSYAHYFYTNKPDRKESILKIEPEKRPYNLLRLKVDKEVYMIVKSHRSSEFEKKYNQFTKINESFGFSLFYKPIQK